MLEATNVRWLRSAAAAAALMVAIALIGILNGDSMPFVTEELIDGYNIKIPTTFELKSQAYRDVLDQTGRSRGNTQPNSDLLLVAGKWSQSSQLAFIGVRTHPEWDRLHLLADKFSSGDWAALHEQRLTRMQGLLDAIGAKIIERLQPALSATKTGDKQVLLRYRRKKATTITTAGLLMVIRPKNSFGVEFSYDEKADTGPLVEFALSSIGHP